MSSQQFSAKLEIKAKKGSIVLPFDPNDVWGEKRQHHVAGLVNGCKIRGALKEEGGHYLLPVGAAWLRGWPISAETNLAISLEPEGPQLYQLESDIVAALNAEPEARAYFEALATFYRKGYLRWISGARKADTRAARIAEMVTLLLAGKKQR